MRTSSNATPKTVIPYIGAALSLVSLILVLGLKNFLDTFQVLGGVYSMIYMIIILLIPIYVIEICISAFRKQGVDWTSLVIVLFGAVMFMSFFGGMNLYEPDIWTYFILYAPQIIWIVLGIKKRIAG